MLYAFIFAFVFSLFLIGFFVVKNRTLTNEIKILKETIHAKECDVCKKEEELEKTNSELCELVSATNDIASKATEENQKLTNRIEEIKNQLKNNTDLEFATVDQIFGELKTRRMQFLLLRPTLNQGVDALASQVSKNDAISVLQAALSALKANESWDEQDGEEGDDWS